VFAESLELLVWFPDVVFLPSLDELTPLPEPPPDSMFEFPALFPPIFVSP
jgi:hypothetical protein